MAVRHSVSVQGGYPTLGSTVMLTLRNRSTKGILLHLCWLLALLTTRTASTQDHPETMDTVEQRVCGGASATDVPAFSTAEHLQSLRTRYTNCTYVHGNLELENIPYDAGLDFLQQIREVTGYLLILNVRKPILNLLNLRIVRGQSLYVYDDHMTTARFCSVFISRNEGLRELGLAQLREISNGQVYMSHNEQLCHVWSTVNWADLLQANSSQPATDSTIQPPNTIPGCLSCHSDCITGYCWGPGREQCQQLTRTICAKQCGQNRCRGPDPSDCCHPECAAGCTGPGANECIACRHFANDGQCVEKCPALEKYDPDHFTNVPDPDGKVAFSTLCVKECPPGFLRYGQDCITKCPDDKQELDGACVNCDGPCPKICPGFQDDTLFTFTSVNWITNITLQRFQNCSVIEGHLVILRESFTDSVETVGEMGFTWSITHGPVEPSQLEQLSTIRKITGYLRIEDGHENMTDLSFLRSLQTIEGRTLEDAPRFTLKIVNNKHLRSLGLNSLRRVKAGNIGIFDNPMLCFADQIAWKKILSESYVITTTDVMSEQLLKNNRDENECVRAGERCHSECTSDGCWGPQHNQCLFCANYKYKSTCLRNCEEWNLSNSLMLYHAGNKKCAHCHAQCRDGCTGPSESFCITCLNVKDGFNCVTECPVSKYSDSQKVCRPCNETCKGGCTGPGSFLGEAGCRSCEMGIVNDDAANSIYCLPAGAQCPPRSFLTIAYNETASMAALIGKKICKPCHPYCIKCRDSGVYNCQACTYFKLNGQCALTCPNTTHYIENGTSLCQPCNSDCSMRGCSGPLSTQCVSCRTYRDYYDPERPQLFNCTTQCPGERVYSTNQSPDPLIVLDPPESLCSKDDTKAKNITFIIVGVIAGVIGVIVIVAIVLCFRVKKSRIQLETLVIQDKFAGIELTEPFEPTDNKPDTSKLRLISEQELRRGEQLGQGAFGIVYKGFWLPPKENLKIPVAIKVLKEGVGPGAAKEILDEAHVMASVNNPHLVSLLALCMTSEIMLITQLLPLGSMLDYVKKNNKGITSRTLLNWCLQIVKAMRYLEKRHMIHRDLAARSVLVERPNWVKVTDFGLARILDCRQESLKSSGGLTEKIPSQMPIKWLAPECIERGVYSHKTDVWAFGVTVWELLTYGQKPFDSVPANELYSLLQSGERLPQPGISTLDVYMLLLKCWSSHPESRPSFVDLAEDFSKMTRDPGRYLVIPGDEYLRLPEYTVDDQQRFFGDIEDVGSEKFMLADDYVRAGDAEHPHNRPPVSPRYTPAPAGLKGKLTGVLRLAAEPARTVTNLGYLVPAESCRETTYLDLRDSLKGKEATRRLPEECEKMPQSGHDSVKEVTAAE